MNNTEEEKPTIHIVVRGLRGLSPEVIMAVAEWVRKEAQMIETRNSELADVYTANYWA